MKGVAALVLVGLVLPACADAAPPSASSAAADTLEVRCDGTTTEVLTPTVQAQHDGVHVLVHNISAGEDLSVSWLGGGDGAAPGDTSFVFPIHPGRSRIRCLPISEDNAMENGDWGSFDVVAPDGWVSPLLDCPAGAYQGVGDYVEGARGIADPLADARRQFRLDGVAVQAGYETTEERIFVNMTNDGPKESLTYIADGFGGWLLSESSGCSD